MPPYHVDNFDRSADLPLNTTAYPAVFTTAAYAIYAETVLRLEDTGGWRFGWVMPSPNWAMEITVNLQAKTDLGAVYLLSRYQPSGEKATANYAAVLSVSNAAGNTHPQDATATTPLLVANKAYLVCFDGTNARVLAEAPLTMALETDYRCRLVANGDRLSLYVDGLLIVEAADDTWREDFWGFGTFGVGLKRLGSTSGESVVDLDDLHVETLEEQMGCMAAVDEAERLIRFSLPIAGAGECGQVLCYHYERKAWTRETLACSCLGQVADARGMARTVYGDPAAGKLWVLDESATRGGQTIEAIWQSNWIQIAEQRQRVIVYAIAVWLATSADLEAEVAVETCDDPADPRSWSRRHLVTRYGPGDPVPVERTGRFVRFRVRHADAGSRLALRRAVLTLLE